MPTPRDLYYEKQGNILVSNLKKRHFDAWYCANRQEALAKALELIPEGASVGWGGARSAQEIGLMDALNAGNYRTIDRDRMKTPEEKQQAARDCLSADVFLTGANGLVIAGMNKVMDSLENAVKRARTVAAPMNEQRFLGNTPCAATGVCADCKSEDCICNQIVITRHCRPAGRIKFILVGEELGF